MKLGLILVTFATIATAINEKWLLNDASNPGGKTEEIVRMGLNSMDLFLNNLSLTFFLILTPVFVSAWIVEIPVFSGVYSKLSKAAKSYPKSVDHRNYLGGARQQSSSAILRDVGCGSCTTFAVIAAAELAYYTAFLKKKYFSEMELVDCMYHAGGCNGNNIELAAKHVYNNGVASRILYPYRSTDKNVCNTLVKREFDYKFIPFHIDQNNPAQWKTFVDNYGGFVIGYYHENLEYEGVSKDSKGRADYSKAIVTNCKGVTKRNGINHAVTVVGYGEQNGVEYFLIRNSWGKTAERHDKGYFRLKVGACNSQLYPYVGFIFDTCNKATTKDACSKKPECTWGKSGKSGETCVSSYSHLQTSTSAAKKEAKDADKKKRKSDEVALNELNVLHGLRKNTFIGTEFMSHLRAAGKTKTKAQVDEFYKKAKNAGYIEKTGKIKNYKKLREMLGLKNPVKTFIAVKARLDSPNQALEKNWYHLLPAFDKGKDGKKAYYDARYNKDDYPDYHKILGTSQDGTISWSDDYVTRMYYDALTLNEKEKYPPVVFCYAAKKGLRFKSKVMPILKSLYKQKAINKKGIVKKDAVGKVLSVNAEVKNSGNTWWLKEGNNWWNCNTNKLEK